MSTVSRAPRLIAIALLCALIGPFLTPSAQAAPAIPSLYTVTNLGTLPQYSDPKRFASRGADLNDAGQIIGRIVDITSPTFPVSEGAFYYENGQMRFIGAGVSLVEINAAGKAVGSRQIAADRWEAVAYDTAGLIALGTLPGERNSSASGINDAGIITGVAGQRTYNNETRTYSGTDYPVIFRDGTVEQLSWRSGDCGGSAEAINGPGQIIGVSEACTNAQTTLVEFTRNGTRDIPAGDLMPHAIGFNDRGDILYQFVCCTFRTSHLYRDGRVTAIPLPKDGVALDAYDINNAGLVVGTVRDVYLREGYGFIYSGGQVFNLNSLIPADSGWVIKEARGLNDRGQIVGYGERNGVQSAILLTPRFPDLTPDNPYRDAILTLAAQGVIRGYDDGRFGPGDIALRAQSAAFIARAVGWDGETWADQNFPDQGNIDDNLWRNVRTLAHYGVALGYADGTYNPTGAVAHQQVALFIARAMIAKGYWAEQPDTAPYPNLPNATDRERADRRAIATYVHYAGAIPDRPVGQPWADWDTPASRGWFAQVLQQALATIPAP